MKSLKEIIFVFAMFIGLALSVPAQADDQKKPPPKGTPPVIKPGEKPPKGNERPPKKPGMSFHFVSADRQSDTA